MAISLLEANSAIRESSENKANRMTTQIVNYNEHESGADIPVRFIRRTGMSAPLSKRSKPIAAGRTDGNSRGHHRQSANPPEDGAQLPAGGHQSRRSADSPERA